MHFNEIDAWQPNDASKKSTWTKMETSQNIRDEWNYVAFYNQGNLINEKNEGYPYMCPNVSTADEADDVYIYDKHYI